MQQNLRSQTCAPEPKFQLQGGAGVLVGQNFRSPTFDPELKLHFPGGGGSRPAVPTILVKLLLVVGVWEIHQHHYFARSVETRVDSLGRNKRYFTCSRLLAESDKLRTGQISSVRGTFPGKWNTKLNVRNDAKSRVPQKKTTYQRWAFSDQK